MNYKLSNDGSMIVEVAPDTIKFRSPDRITSIAPYAFINCYNLEYVYLPNVTKIHVEAFWNCTLLETVIMPNVIEIGDSAFRYCSNLKNVDIPKVEIICMHAFHQCYKLKYISKILPKNILIKIFGNEDRANTYLIDRRDYILNKLNIND